MPAIQNPATGLDVGDPDRILLDPDRLPDRAAIAAAAEGLILSASGWRKVFALHREGDPVASWFRRGTGADPAEDSLSPAVSDADKVLAGAMALAFGEFMRARAVDGTATGTGTASGRRPAVLLGIDSRPSGRLLGELFCRVLTALDIDVRYLFIVAAPEIMAYAGYAATLPEGHPEKADGFAYISASHNPPGHNGVKFGAGSGGVLSAAEIAPLIAAYRALIAAPDTPARIAALSSGAEAAALRRVLTGTAQWKRFAVSAYTLFSHLVVTGKTDLAEQGTLLDELEASCRADPIGVVADLNGSARCLSVDRDWLEALGVGVRVIGGRVGEFSHRIVPEGISLDACRAELESAHRDHPEFQLGYSPDCDGDRGNLVWFDRGAAGAGAGGAARILEAQEVFALCCVAELASLARDGVFAGGARVAIAVNDGTSMRIEHIASQFGARVFRAETGEANVVGLAERLRAEGWIVRILGEGSNGGNITHPARVRDPLATLGAILKLLRLRDGPGGQGLFRIWMEASGQADRMRPDFDLSDIIGSLPGWVTTSVFEPRAGLKVASADKVALKRRYRDVFLEEWAFRREELAARWGIAGWRGFASNGASEREIGDRFEDSGSGGLRILFTDPAGAPKAFLWMRGSGTEPVFRIMADIAGGGSGDEAYFLEWHAAMVRRADSGH